MKSIVIGNVKFDVDSAKKLSRSKFIKKYEIFKDFVDLDAAYTEITGKKSSSE